MKNTETTETTKLTRSPKKRMGFAPIWLLAFLFALPSCFEISCIKLVGCELLAEDIDPDDNMMGNTSGDLGDYIAPIERPSETAKQILSDFVIE